MKAYLDSGIFIDYLIGRAYAVQVLRSTARRGRTPAQLGSDAENCLTKLSRSHASLTSSLTCYEVEEAMYRELKRSVTGMAHASKYIIPAARSVITQTLMTIDLFDVQIANLTSTIVLTQCQNIDLQMKGVRAADALHITTALVEGADVVISADDDILALDSIFLTMTGAPLRCIDTDLALSLL